MKRKKQKQPSKTMCPSRKKAWTRAMSRFHLSPEELAKARAAGFTPTLMDEVATARKVKRGIHDKLPLHATAGQVGRIKREIREHYETLFGEAPPPATATSQVKRSKEARLEARVQVEARRDDPHGVTGARSSGMCESRAQSRGGSSSRSRCAVSEKPRSRHGVRNPSS